MYVCVRCKTEYDEYPESKKCKACSGRAFVKKRDPVVRKVNTD
jgi:DNA-directed RNA polymerase subunit RPC12/RpoP